MDVVETIKIMLAPAVMVNCCGLFILGMNNKYSVVVGRIRALEEEKRRLKATASNKTLLEHEELRLKSIHLQTDKLFYRIQLVRNAVVCYSIAVAFFIATCLVIGIDLAISDNSFTKPLSIIFFFAGLLCVFIGIYFATKEAMKGYEIVKIEVNDCV